PKKGEFESTNEYNERLNAFYDRTAYYLEEYALKETKSILEILVKDSKFILDSYNADKGVYAVYAIIDGGCRDLDINAFGYDFDCSNNITIVGDTVKSTISISPQEAQLLKTGGSTFNISPTDIYWKDYLVYPSKITVTSKADTTKKYVVNFPKPTGASDILFKGSELWANNPKAKNLVYNFKDLAAELSAKQEQQRAEQERIAEEKRLEEERIAEEKRLQEEQERIAEKQRAEKERAEEQEQKNMEEWAKRVSIYSALILKLPSGDIRFEIGKPFPFEVIDKSFEIQGKTVYFTKSGKSVYVKINDIYNVVVIYLKAKQNIREINYFWSYNAPFSRLIVKDYLGYGVFDFE
ncbi:MAG: hypothetical protein FWF51_11875, partial [Chitinivibrionia bacterium]|nr:hypothetical protein [Chitinivibrionia bacterium]